MPELQTSGLKEKAADALVRMRWPLGIAAILLAAVAWPQAQQLQLDRSLIASVAKDTEYVKEYEQSEQIFGPHNEVMVAYAQPDLFQPDSFDLTPEAAEHDRRLVEQLQQVPGVEESRIYYLAEAFEFQFRKQRLVELLEGMLIGTDHETVAIVLQLQPADRALVSRAETIRRIREIASEQQPPAYVVGEPVIVEDAYRYLQEDGELLFYVSLALLELVTLLLFRGLRWVLLPLLVVAATIAWTRALLAMWGFQLSMVSSMLNALVAVVAVATVMHVIVQFGQRNRGVDRRQAFRQTVTDIGPPIFWTCATTAVGFAALLSSSIHPVRSFATMMTLGSLLVLVAVAALLPGGILIGRWDSQPKNAPGQTHLLRFLSRLASWTEHYPWRVSGSALIIAVATGAGLTRLEVQSDLTKNFRESAPLVEALEFIEQRLGGTGSWEVNFPAPTRLTADYLNRVDRLAGDLRDIGGEGEPRLTKVSTLPDWVGLVPEFPLLLDTLEKRTALLTSFQPGILDNFYNPDAGRMRILLRSKQRMATDEKLELTARVRAVTRQHFPDAAVTGSYVLMAHTVSNLLQDQLISLILATAGIVLMVSLAFRSIALGLIAIVPNTFPILLVVGTMGWIGIPVNPGTAMIAAISVGLTVDGTVHYVAGYRRARRAGRGRDEALRETHQDVGRALLFATLALVIGFSVLSLSHFLPLVHFGVLISFAMAGGLVADLLILPVMLRLIERDSGRRSKETSSR